MKLIIAIISSDDSNKLTNALNLKGYSVTRLATSGGFLRTGNTTLMIGVEEDKIEDVMDTIKSQCQTRKQITASSTPIGGVMPHPVEIETGGATIFVVDVENFEKV